MDRITIPDGNHDAATVRNYCLQAQKRTMEQMTMAFMINLLPAVLRTKLLEKEPDTIGEVFKTFEQIQEHYLNESRPVAQTSKPLIHMLENEEYMEDPELIAAVQNFQRKKWGQGPQAAQNNNNRSQKKSGKQNKSDSNKADKKCNHCNKMGHGVVECFKRIREGAPCFNTKGDPFYPASDKTSPHAPKVNTNSSVNPVAPAKDQPSTNTGKEGGLEKKDFPAWV